MAKSAGFLKKLKKIGGLIGKGASWINKNIVKPLNPVIDTVLDFVPGGGVIKTAKNFVSNAVDNFLPAAEENKQVQDIARFGADVALEKLDKMEEQIMMLVDNPYMGIDPKYMILRRQGYKVLVLEKNLVFYKVDEVKKVVTVYAVVDQRQDYLNIIRGL